MEGIHPLQHLFTKFLLNVYDKVLNKINRGFYNGLEGENDQSITFYGTWALHSLIVRAYC